MAFGKTHDIFQGLPHILTQIASVFWFLSLLKLSFISSLCCGGEGVFFLPLSDNLLKVVCQCELLQVHFFSTQFPLQGQGM